MKNLILLLICLFYTANSFAVLQVNRTPRLPYNLAIAKERVSNATLIHGFFDSTDLTTTEKTVWSGPGIYVYPTAAIQMTVSSSDVDDTAAGAGMRKVLIGGLDADYNQISEIVTLNGQTPVTTVNSYFRVQGTGMFGQEVGVTESNEGIVYIGTGTVTAGVPATIYNLITIGDNSSHSGFFTVPAGFDGYFYDVQISSVSNKPLQVRGVERNGTPVFFQFSGFNVDGFVKSDPPFPDHIHEKTDIQFRAKMVSGTGEVQAHAHLLMIK